MPSSTTMPNLKKSRSTKPKLFHCTGYGECNMVFTRSEHLARHTRKHTGEKPFKCVVPGCTRRFSRFDNMMQHTQTHRSSSRTSQSPTPTITDVSSSSSIASDEETNIVPLCQPTTPLKELHLTQDEFEALQGFGRFQHTPVFIDSFRDLAQVVYIEPNPI
ncbi:hypothetical protein BY458DRAFT_508457, partial [Sporodiniella umbellata]